MNPRVNRAVTRFLVSDFASKVSTHRVERVQPPLPPSPGTNILLREFPATAERQVLLSFSAGTPILRDRKTLIVRYYM